MIYEIKLKAIAFNTVPITLDGEQFTLQTIWSDRGVNGGTWRLNILDGDGEQIVSGLSMYPNRALTGEYIYTKMPKGLLMVQSKNASTIRPDFDSLGVSLKLFYMDEEEFNGITV